MQNRTKDLSRTPEGRVLYTIRSPIYTTMNPFEATMPESSTRLHSTGRPRLVCSVITTLGVPAWFFGLIAIIDMVKPIDNPAGIPAYMMMCLALLVFIVPLNALILAPAIAHFGYPSHLRSAWLHFVAGLFAFALLWYWPSFIGRMPSIDWTIIPYYLCTFLLPPMLAGSLAYSLRYNAMKPQIAANNPINRSGG